MLSMSQMPYHLGVKIRIKPTEAQKTMIQNNSNGTRAVYNKLVFYDRYVNDMKEVYGLSRFYNDPMIRSWVKDVYKKKMTVKDMKQHMPFLLHDFDSLAGANAVKNHNRAWQNHRQDRYRYGFPTFHSKKQHPYEDTYQTNAQYVKSHCNVYFDDHYQTIKLPKLGFVEVRYVRKLLKHKKDFRIGTITIHKNARNQYYVSLQLGSETPFKNYQKPITNQIIAGDLNTEDLLVFNDGRKIKNPRFYHQSIKRLIHLQRRLDQLKRYHQKHHQRYFDLKNYQRLRLKIAKLHCRIAEQRHDYFVKVLTNIFENQDILVLEKLQNKVMLSKHGHKSSYKHLLHQKISDSSWGMFINIAQSMAEQYHKQVVLINPKNTTQMCHYCHFIKRGKDKIKLHGNQQHHTDHGQYICYNPQCSHYMVLQNRDVNAARNIFQRGLKKLQVELIK